MDKRYPNILSKRTLPNLLVRFIFKTLLLDHDLLNLAFQFDELKSRGFLFERKINIKLCGFGIKPTENSNQFHIGNTHQKSTLTEIGAQIDC